MECGYGRPHLSIGQLSELRELCDFYGLQLIFDEGRVGLGRSGHVFAYEPMGVVPDALVTGREVGGPFKIGFCLLTNEAAHGVSLCRESNRAVPPASIESIAYASSTIAMMAERAFATHVRSMSRRITTRLKRLALKFPFIVKDTRCAGLKFEIECISQSHELHLLMKEEGLLGGIAQNRKIVLTPPLVITAKEVDEGLVCINRALTRLQKSRKLSVSI
jgi:acetylornithine/N-succinyldiaminopimelate aminotransferase